MDYNTQRSHLVISEYGRNVQQMANHLLTITDDAKRQQQAELLVETMAILNTQLKGVEDYKQRFWDHLYVITDYKLDVENPYGMPERAAKEAKPEPLAYPKNKIKWNQLGKNVEVLLAKAIAETDAEKQNGYAQALGNYIKVAYKNYHDENVTDEQVKEELLKMSDGKLNFEPNEFRKWVDGTLNESPMVGALKNYKPLTNANAGQKNRNNFGRNNNNNNKNSGNNRGKYGNNKFKRSL
jgi:hypothetical protein